MHPAQDDSKQSRSLSEMREDAWREYEAARAGIEKYDEHLYRIRQWNIALTAASIAGILGLAQTGNFKPSAALFGYTAICFVFWSLDAMNKSLQTVHVHVSRDVERYLRGETDIYIGPAISMRFNRKSKRHLVEAVKNLTDNSLCFFYIMPLILFWILVLSSGHGRLCFKFTCILSVNRLMPIVCLLLLAFVLYLSWLWKRGQPDGRPYCVRRRYFLRRYSAERWRWRELVKQNITRAARGSVADDVRICLFNIDFMNTKTGVVLLVDRYPLSKNLDYIQERQRCLERLGLLVLRIDWKPPHWTKCLSAAPPILNHENLGHINLLCQMGAPSPGYSPGLLGLSSTAAT